MRACAGKRRARRQRTASPSWRRGRRSVSHHPGVEAARRRRVSVSRRPAGERCAAAESRAAPAAGGGRHHGEHRARPRRNRSPRSCSASIRRSRAWKARRSCMRAWSTAAVRPGARGLERRRAAEPRRVEDGARRFAAWATRRARAFSITHDTVARLFAVPERLLHVRRDRQPAHRSRRAGVSMPHGGRRGAEQGGVRRRGGRHQAELSRLRVLRRATTCCSMPAARSGATADRC